MSLPATAPSPRPFKLFESSEMVVLPGAAGSVKKPFNRIEPGFNLAGFGAFEGTEDEQIAKIAGVTTFFMKWIAITYLLFNRLRTISG